jgi:hypothetical protein
MFKKKKTDKLVKSMKDRPEMRNSYQIGQGPETP